MFEALFVTCAGLTIAAALQLILSEKQRKRIDLLEHQIDSLNRMTLKHGEFSIDIAKHVEQLQKKVN